MLAVLIAADGTPAFDAGAWLPQLGSVGLIVALSIAGILWWKPSIDQLKADKARAEAQRDALIEVYQAKVIPVLKDTSEKVVPTLATLTADLADIRREARDDRAELRRAFDELSRDVRAKP